MHDSPRQGLAVGFFDGVHLGHREILSGAAEALTFRAHPLTVLNPVRAPKLLMDLESRLAAIRARGVVRVTVLDFTPDFAKLHPAEFAARYLAGRGPIRCGANWRFGADGKGDAAFLRQLGYEVKVIPNALVGGAIVSSTRIREALREGRLEEAECLLGHPWSLCGRVVRGKGEGRLLGFPTVNVVPFEEPPLAHGVYSAEVQGIAALANYGVAPTFGERAWSQPVMEIHFPDSSDGCISVKCTERVSVILRSFLRPERKFSNRDELRAAIAADCAHVMKKG